MAHEIILNHLTGDEHARKDGAFAEYKDCVTRMLQIKNLFLFEDEILERYKGQTMDELMARHPDKFVPAPKKKKGNKFVNTWFDIWMDYTFTPKDFSYDVFFIYHLRNTDLMETDEFLSYQLEKHFESDTVRFYRFLKLAIRKHWKTLLQIEQVETVNEWISHNEKTAFAETGITSAKEKHKREADDGITALNQEQTALLIDFLQTAKIIFPDEKQLSKRLAGDAFSVLTGYSADTLRQALSKPNLAKIANKKNLNAIYNIIVRLQNLVEKEIRNKK